MDKYEWTGTDGVLRRVERVAGTLISKGWEDCERAILEAIRSQVPLPFGADAVAALDAVTECIRAGRHRPEGFDPGSAPAPGTYINRQAPPWSDKPEPVGEGRFQAGQFMKPPPAWAGADEVNLVKGVGDTVAVGDIIRLSTATSFLIVDPKPLLELAMYASKHASLTWATIALCQLREAGVIPGE